MNFPLESWISLILSKIYSKIHVNEKGVPFKSAKQLAAILRRTYQEAGIDTGKWNINNARHAVITFYKGKGISEE
jgi:hypothetical protein